MNRFNQLTQSSVADSLSGGDFGKLTNYYSSFNNYSGTTDAAAQSVLSQTAASIETGIREGMNSYLSSDNNALTSDLKSVIKNLMSQKDSSNNAKEKWLSGGSWYGGSNVGNLNKSFASTLWDYYWRVKNAGGDVFADVNATDDSTLASEISSDLAGYVKYNLMSKVLPTTSK